MASAAESNTRTLVRERSGGVCELALPGICHGRATNVSHRKSRGQGGGWSPANCMDACGSGTTGCHGWVEANPAEAIVLGLRVPGTVPPPLIGEIPARMRTAQWPLGQYLLHDDGTLTPCQ